MAGKPIKRGRRPGTNTQIVQQIISFLAGARSMAGLVVLADASPREWKRARRTGAYYVFRLRGKDGPIVAGLDLDGDELKWVKGATGVIPSDEQLAHQAIQKAIKSVPGLELNRGSVSRSLDGKAISVFGSR